MAHPKGRQQRATLAEHVWAQVDRGDGCWLWTGNIAKHGYGRITVRPKMLYAHRVVYELLVGPIPEGLELDHLCRNRACVNPAHLEPVTHRVNSLRGTGICATRAAQTHCIRGHLLDGENLYEPPRGGRQCRACRKAAMDQFASRRRARVES